MSDDVMKRGTGMKFFHLSDLHIGKFLNGYNLRENQESVLMQIVAHARREKPDAILICGDIYDRAAPSGEAWQMCDRFLRELSEIRPSIPVLLIAGNHDSPDRLSYASSFLEKHHICISVWPPRSEEEHLKKILLEDEYGPVAFYLLPFLKPGYVRPLFGEDKISDYESAVRAVLEREEIDTSIRNVILSHQFYAGKNTMPDTCESETAVIMAGGLDMVSASVLDAFDYAALGHLHGGQSCGRREVRYCGSPCKYSVSEADHKKALLMVTMGRKGEEVRLDFLPLEAPEDVRRVKGSLEEVLAAGRAFGAAWWEREEGEKSEPEPDPALSRRCRDYVSITVTEEEGSYRVRERLEEVYDHMLELRFDNARTRMRLQQEGEEMPFLQPLEAFRLFFERVRHEPLSAEEERIMERIIQEAKEEER